MLESRNVFIDTQVFVQNKFRFDHPTLKRLLELGSSCLIQLVLTDTVVGEVRAKLTEQFTEATKSLGQFHKHINIVESILPAQYQGLIAKPSEEELVGLAMQAWDTYITNSRALIVPSNSVNGANLLALYFGSKPPFGDGHKKNEFPDAITVLSLLDWMKTNKTKLYVISQDKDIVSWCAITSDVFHVNSLAEFIDLYNRCEEKLTELVHLLFENEKAFFLDAIKEQFLSCGFVYEDNWEASVDYVDVTEISVHEINIIEVKETSAFISVMVNINFSAEINGPDFDNGIWDSEDKKYAYIPDFNLAHAFEEQYEVSVEFKFSAETNEVEQILNITVENGDDIGLRIDYGYPYK